VSAIPHSSAAHEATAAARWAGEQREHAEPGTSQEIFLYLLERAAHARLRGDYAIAAALVVRSRGLETIYFGESTLFSRRDPLGHAEVNAIRRALAAAASGGRRSGSSGSSEVIVRSAPHGHDETLLYSTLEPCPMCTVAIINAGIGKVCVAHEDPHAGALLRLDSLTEVWPAIARERGLEIGTPGEMASEVGPELLSRLVDLFESTRGELDQQLEGHGVLPDAQA
jgi:tRNA(Arg) A34 adenosine deaminase TadA